MFNEPDEMARKLAEYLEFEDNMKGKSDKGLYTIEGAALYLGFASRQSMHDYEKKNDQFAYVLHRFKLFLTHWNVQKLYWGGTYMAAQFWLRNHGGYTDETVVNQNQTVTHVQPQVVDPGVALSSSEGEVKE